jgi:cell division protein ZapA
MSDLQNSNTVSVKILGQEYKIKCPPDKISELQESAIHLDKFMQEVRDGSQVLSVDRIAVIAALNIAHEMLILKKQKNNYIELLSKRIAELEMKIEHAMASETTS